MSALKKFNYLFRKFPLVRASVFLLVIGLVVFFIYFFNKKTAIEPYIESIDPPVGAPGDVVVINGKNFGAVKDMSYVEIAGSRLTESSYINWSDDCIKIVLPPDVQDGLVFVGTKDKKVFSNPALFTNEIDIPVPVTPVAEVTRPLITSLSDTKLYIGESLTIFGSNFGDTRDQSKVYFTIDYDQQMENNQFFNKSLLTENMIPVSEEDGGYEYWSNTEIRVRVPDGAYSGVIVVDNSKEKSENFDYQVVNVFGKKSFNSQTVFLVYYSADLSDVNLSSTDSSTITLRCPLPEILPSQPEYEITEINPEPILQNFNNCLIHQINKKRNNLEKNLFQQTFAIPVYEINTKMINVERFGSYKEMNQEMYNKYTKPDVITPCDNEDVIRKAKEIVGNEKNPYRQARLIYKYMLNEYKIRDEVRRDKVEPLHLLSRKSGDAYDFAIIYTAMLRSLGIPCVTDAGILVGEGVKTQAHWWCEFYIQNFGWIPVDPALGAGMEYKPLTDFTEESAADYYFGNLDSYHITFSRGVNDIKPFTQENKIVQYSKTYALQTIWEEYTNTTSKYSSYWSLPIIIGVY